MLFTIKSSGKDNIIPMLDDTVSSWEIIDIIFIRSCHKNRSLIIGFSFIYELNRSNKNNSHKLNVVFFFMNYIMSMIVFSFDIIED